MNYRIRNLQCVFQHLNIVTVENGYDMMLLLALKSCPGVCHQSIVEMLDILVSNAAWTGGEDQRTGSAVSKSLQHSSAQFQAIFMGQKVIRKPMRVAQEEVSSSSCWKGSQATTDNSLPSSAC